MKITKQNSIQIVGMGLICHACGSRPAVKQVLVRDYGDGSTMNLCLCGVCIWSSAEDLERSQLSHKGAK